MAVENENSGKKENRGGILGGIIKNRIDNLGDAVKQSVTDLQGNVTTSLRTGFGVLKDENTSHLKTEFDEETPVFEIMATNAGKNARVRLLPDRLEWEKGRGISSGKVLAGIMTVGASLLVTGLRGAKDEFETLPLTAVTNISISKPKGRHQIVSVTTAGGAIDFEVSRYNAADFRLAILTQMQANAAKPLKVEFAQPLAPVPTPAPVEQKMDFSETLQKLAELRDAGVLTAAEFEAKKAEILGNL